MSFSTQTERWRTYDRTETRLFPAGESESLFVWSWDSTFGDLSRSVVTFENVGEALRKAFLNIWGGRRRDKRAGRVDGEQERGEFLSWWLRNERIFDKV